MIEPTNYLNNLNKRIDIASSEIANVQLKESFVLNSQRNALDFSNIGAYLNDVIVASYSTLCSAPRYPKDAVANGLSGDTIATWLEGDGNNKYNEDVFWFKPSNPDAEGRPCTIKESIQHIWANLTPIITQVNGGNQVDLAPLEDSINCLNTKMIRLKTDSFGDNFVLNCEAGWTKQTWPISKHVFEILRQLTAGHNVDDLVGLNSINQEEYPDYPGLTWAISLNDLTDVDTTTRVPESGDSLVWNEEAGKWQPENADIKYINELYDVDTSTTEPAANDVLVWNPDHKDNSPGLDEVSGAWIPKSPSELFQDTTIGYIDELKDVEIGSEELGDGHVLTWIENVVDSDETDLNVTGAWVPRANNKVEYISELKDVNTTGELQENDLLVWDPNARDDQTPVDQEEADGAWIVKSPSDLFQDTKVERISELIDVNVTGSTLATNDILVWDANAFDESDENEETPGVWIAKQASELFSDTKIESINELIDVDTSASTLSDNQILVWDSSHQDSGSENSVGSWIAKDLDELVTVPDASQRIGNLQLSDGANFIDGSSSIEDVADWGDLFRSAVEETIADPSNAELIMSQFIQKANKKYRPGSLLHFNGFDKWYSNLGGNTSNLNALNYMPETFSKGTSFLLNRTGTELEQITYGGATPVPFVFINSFSLSYKELRDPTYRNTILEKEFNQASEETTFDDGILEAIIGDDYEPSAAKLNNEIEDVEKTNSLAITSTSLIYENNNELNFEYEPSHLLGVSRTDLSKEVDATFSATERFFLLDSTDSSRLSGEINPNSISDIQQRVNLGIGNEVQHSGYSKIMCIGPHEIGDRVYICPEPLLHIFGIKYSYGIVISDSFLNTPINEYVDKTGIITGWSDTSLNLSMYNYILNKLEESSGSITQEYKELLVSNNLVNKIKSNPVGFITKKEGMKNLPYIETVIKRDNIADIICRNLMGPCAYSSISEYGTTGIDEFSVQVIGLFEIASNALAAAIVAESGGGINDLLNINSPPYKILDKMHDITEIHLPTIKIQMPGFNYQEVVSNNPFYFVPEFYDWSGVLDDLFQFNLTDTGDLYLNNSLLGNLIGPQGPRGLTGESGSSGSNGENAPIFINSPTINYYEGDPNSKGGSIAVGTNLVSDSHLFNNLLITKNSYPSLSNFSFTLQLRVSGLNQPVKIIVDSVSLPADSTNADDVPLLLPTLISGEGTGTQSNLMLYPSDQSQENGITVYNNETIEIVQKGNPFELGDSSRGVVLQLRIQTSSEVSNLSEIFSSINASFILK